MIESSGAPFIIVVIAPLSALVRVHQLQIRGIERSKRSLGPTRDTLHERIHARRSSLIDKNVRFEILDEPPINVEELYDYWWVMRGFFRVSLDKRKNWTKNLLSFESDLNICRICFCCFEMFSCYNNWLVVVVLYGNFLDRWWYGKKRKKRVIIRKIVGSDLHSCGIRR